MKQPLGSTLLVGPLHYILISSDQPVDLKGKSKPYTQLLLIEREVGKFILNYRSTSGGKDALSFKNDRKWLGIAVAHVTGNTNN